MYHFVKFNDTWYLKPEKLEDVIDHFKKFCGREFKEGFEDYRNNSVIRTSYDGTKYRDSKNHSSSVWRYAVEMTMDFKGGTCSNLHHLLKKEHIKTELRNFLKANQFSSPMGFLIILLLSGLNMMKRFGKMNLNSLMNINMRIVDSYSGLVEDIGM